MYSRVFDTFPPPTNSSLNCCRQFRSSSTVSFFHKKTRPHRPRTLSVYKEFQQTNEPALDGFFITSSYTRHHRQCLPSIKTKKFPYPPSTAKPDQSTSSAKSIDPTPARPYSLSSIKPDQSKTGLKSVLPTPALPHSLRTFKPAQSEALAKPVPPTLALELSECPSTKPIKGKFAPPFDEQTKDSLQLDFNFFGMDGEDTVFELREGKDHGRYQIRSDFENNVASYQRVGLGGNHGSLRAHTVAINIVLQEKAADVAKGIESI